MGVTNSPLRDRVLFVEGSQRSGTTWLNVLLATHPEIAGSAIELHLFTQALRGLFDNYDSWDATGAGIAPVLSRAELADAARDVADRILLRMLEKTKPEARFVVEKTPIGAGSRTDLVRKRESYPDAWYLHIVRDGRAVAQSLMRAPWVQDRSPEACLREWQSAVDDIRAVLGDSPRYHEISYEDLRADPAAVCGEVFTWLGLDADDDVLERVRAAAGAPAARFDPAPSEARLGGLAYARARIINWARRGPGARPVAERHADPLIATFAQAMRRRDAEALRSLTTDDFELELHTGVGDLRERGDAARTKVLEIAHQAFARMHISESWSVSSGSDFHTLVFSARTADARLIDMSLHLVARDRRVQRLIVVAAGSPAGRAETLYSTIVDTAAPVTG